MSKNRNEYCPAAHAAAIRSCLKNKMSVKKSFEYMRWLFDTLCIKGEDSYAQLFEKLKNKAYIDELFDLVEAREDADEMTAFIVEFMDIDQAALDAYSTLPEQSAVPKPVLNILSCEVKMQTLSALEKVNYIELSDKKFAQLEADLKAAEHLEKLPQIADQIAETGETKIMLICNNFQTGLIASKYLCASIKDIVDDEGCDEDRDADAAEYNDGDDAAAFKGKLPLVYAKDIDRYYMENMGDEGSGGFGGFDALRKEDSKKYIPFWERFTSIPLLVIIEDTDYLSKNYALKFNTFCQNHVDVITLYVRNDKTAASGSIIGYIESWNNVETVEDILFECGMKEYQIDEPALNSAYYKRVFNDMALEKGFAVAENVDIGNVLQRLMKLREKKWDSNLTIGQLMHKVTSSKRGGDKLLVQADFNFQGFKLEARKSQVDEGGQNCGKTEMEIMNETFYGLDHVKEEIIAAVNTIRIKKRREKVGLKGTMINNTFAFMGPPGVGKTEMAMAMAKILFNSGLMPGNKFLNINAAELKGAYVGQTAPKVTNAFEKYDILFFDEIYSLSAQIHGDMDTFSQEALAQLCVEIEKHSRDKIVILAGYGGTDVPKEHNKMKQFLNANPGLSSRITFHVDFPSYTSDGEMPQILNKMAQNMDYELEDGWRDIAISFFSERAKAESYGNAREARRLLQSAIGFQASRLVPLQSNDIASLRLINCEDLRKAATKILAGEKSIEGKKSNNIGF